MVRCLGWQQHAVPPVQEAHDPDLSGLLPLSS
jgi:hypothetical protein